MANLKLIERKIFEDLFGMDTGYVLNFTNKTFKSFFQETAEIDIYDDKYAIYGDSKAKRLRAFWDSEPDFLVGKILKELLEIWDYETPKKTKEELQKYKKAQKIVNRLLAQKKTKINDDDKFLEQKFSIDLEKLNISEKLKKIIKDRLNEINICLSNGAYLAVVLLCGSTLEGLMLNLAQQFPKQFNLAKASPKLKNGKVKPFNSWTLKDFIDVSYELNFVDSNVKKYSHSLREFRNFIHPNEQLKENFKPDVHTAKISWQVLQLVLYKLSNLKFERRQPCPTLTNSQSNNLL